jgi:uncharacterized protein YndB with AHSA1/START domain
MKIHFWLRPLVLILALSANVGFALAEVADRSDAGFTVKYTAAITAPPEQAFSKIVDIAKWWASDHTYSGDARNLSIEAKPGGCFCERLPKGGGVEHMRVVYFVPGQILRMTGGLGPLQSHGVAGSLSIDIAKSKTSNILSLTYRVGGYIPGGVQSMAAPVDMVLGLQFKRLTNLIERGSATLESKD